jgi:peptidoglycan/xylan/chitin deacetylase (PgdA/CDA1 family)
MNPWWIAAPTIVTGMAGMTAYAAVHARSQLFGRALCTTNAPRKLALTFDDGPNPSVTPKLLDLLDRHKVKATFFVIGTFARGCPELLKETYSRGHDIGNHTDSHPNLFFCGPEETRTELQRCSETIQNIILEDLAIVALGSLRSSTDRICTWSAGRCFREIGARNPSDGS